jgi:hypothetical protein
MTEAKERLFEDELVKNIVSADTKLAPEFCLKSGWVGSSLRDGYSRLYIATPEMTEWLEFRDEDCVYRTGIPSDLTLGGSILWFKSDTKFSYVRTRPLKAQADFLEGDIRRRFMSEAAVANLGGIVATGWVCVTIVSLLACTIFSTCHHVAESGCSDPPDK